MDEVVALVVDVVELAGESTLTFVVEPDRNSRIEVPAGTWRVKVSRHENVLMERRLFISAGETRAFDLK